MIHVLKFDVDCAFEYICITENEYKKYKSKCKFSKLSLKFTENVNFTEKVCKI